MKKEIIKYIDQLKEHKDIVGIFIFGSYALETNHSFSDVDLYVVYDKDSNIEKIDYIKKYGLYFQHQWRTKEEFKNKIVKITRNKPLGEYAKIMYDPSGVIEEYLIKSKENTKLGPKKMMEDERKLFINSIECELYSAQGMIKSDEIGCFILLNEIILNILNLYYDKNGWWLKSEKHLIKDLKYRNNEVGVLAEKSLLIQNPLEKLKLVNKLFQIV